MAKKDVLIAKAAYVMKQPKVIAWYESHLTGKPQEDTLMALDSAVVKGELNNMEALAIALIVGFQWEINFEKENP